MMEHHVKHHKLISIKSSDKVEDHRKHMQSPIIEIRASDTFYTIVKILP
jgi:ASC-1-like (ASCH) protein